MRIVDGCATCGHERRHHTTNPDGVIGNDCYDPHTYGVRLHCLPPYPARGSSCGCDGFVARRPVLIGQAPARTSEGRGAFRGPSGERLARILGVSIEALLGAVDARNLLDHYPGAHETATSGDAFPLDEARAAAAAMLPDLHNRRVLLAGRGVAVCFADGSPRLRHTLPMFEWAEHDAGFSACIIPHPSGTSRFWNDPTRRRAAAESLLSILGLTPAQKDLFA